MEDCGFILADKTGPVAPSDPDSFHIITILESIAIMMNVWFLIKFIEQSKGNRSSENIFIASVLGDNTSALSWMRVTGRTRPAVRCLTRVLAGLLMHNPYLFSFPKKQYIKGKVNIAANALSRPSTVMPSRGCAAMQKAYPTRAVQTLLHTKSCGTCLRVFPGSFSLSRPRQCLRA
jgi:hypothetical protein